MGTKFGDRRRRRFSFARAVAWGIGVAALATTAAAESQEPRALDDVPHVQPVSPDSLLAPENEAPVAEPSAASVPPYRRDVLIDAQQAMAVARARLDAANAAYSKMMKRNYPRGEAKAAIVAERDVARAASAQAAARLRDLGGSVPAAPVER
ncbi:MAG: hypothetical protein VCB99_13130 [Myxococcota bacterium]